MRLSGTLKKWNEQRGFGFISVNGESREIFVHISAFERRGIRPRVGELFGFESETGADGRQRAVRVRQYGEAAPAPYRPVTAQRKSASPLAALALLALIVAGGWFFANRIQAPAPAANILAPAAGVHAATVRSVPQPLYRCDGRTQCSQMRSCAEARYFLTTCPNTQMDGDGDGVPCEQQWCSN